MLVSFRLQAEMSTAHALAEMSPTPVSGPLAFSLRILPANVTPQNRPVVQQQAAPLMVHMLSGSDSSPVGMGARESLAPWPSLSGSCRPAGLPKARPHTPAGWTPGRPHGLSRPAPGACGAAIPQPQHPADGAGAC